MAAHTEYMGLHDIISNLCIGKALGRHQVIVYDEHGSCTGMLIFTSCLPMTMNAPAVCTSHLSLQPCGVDYELKTYVADSVDEKPHKRLEYTFTVKSVFVKLDQPMFCLKSL